MKTIQEIKTEFEQVLSEVRKNGFPEDVAFSIASLILQESGKFQRTQILNGNRNYSNGGDKPISEKQRKFLLDLGIEITPNMTSREAHELIEQRKGKGK